MQCQPDAGCCPVATVSILIGYALPDEVEGVSLRAIHFRHVEAGIHFCKVRLVEIETASISLSAIYIASSSRIGIMHWLASLQSRTAANDDPKTNRLRWFVVSAGGQLSTPMCEDAVQLIVALLRSRQTTARRKCLLFHV